MSNKALTAQVAHLREATQALLLEIQQIKDQIRGGTEFKEIETISEPRATITPQTRSFMGRGVSVKPVEVHGVAESLIARAKVKGTVLPNDPVKTRGKKQLSSETQAVLDIMLGMNKVGDERAWEITVVPFDAAVLKRNTEAIRTKIHYVCQTKVPWACSDTRISYATFVDDVNLITDEHGGIIGHRLVVRRIEPQARRSGRRWIDDQLRGVTNPKPFDESI